LRLDTRQNKNREQELEQSEGIPVRLPPVRVRTERQEVSAFLRETGGHQMRGCVPLTFPFRWLALPVIRDLIVKCISSGCLPIHEAQNFAYERELLMDTDYVLGVEACRTPSPPRLTLRWSISTLQGDICARLETVLRIVPTASKPA
jgi:hypothetical protein